MTPRSWIPAIALTAILASARCFAVGGLPLDPSNFTNPNQLLTPSITNAIVKTVGLAADNRPYEPATPLGTALGLDLGIEITLVKIPDDFIQALAQAGLNGASTLPAIPLPKISLHKGISDSVDIGFSGIIYQGYDIYGGDLKIVLSQPEEGPTWAMRFNYTYANLGFAATNTVTPEVLMSRLLEFADPYIGVGYQYTWGTVTIPLDLPPPAPSESLSNSGSGGGFLAFAGVALRVPNLGFKITVEGAYSSAGASTLGSKVGFQF